jgi:hypothetical protein
MEAMDYNDNILYVATTTKKSLEKYAAAERLRNADNPIMRDMITWKSLANHILLNEVQKRGHYVGKAKQG